MQHDPSNILDYASPSLERRFPIPLTLAIILTAIAALLTTVQWLEIAYRLKLFFRDYHATPYLNHVDDGTFNTYYTCGAVAFALASLAVFFFSARHLKILGILLALVCASAPLTFYVMHQSHILVKYSEFIRHGLGP